MGKTLFGMSKTSIIGVLSLFTVVGLALLQSGSPLIGPKPTMWITLVLAVLTAITRFTQGDAPTDPPEPTPGPSATPPATKIAGLVLMAVLLPLLWGALGCTGWERTTYQALAASKAVIDQAGLDYNSGAIAKSAANEAIILEARKAQTTAVDAMATYEELKASAAAPGALTTQQAVVVTALAVIPPLVAEIRALYTTKTSTLRQPAWRIDLWTLQPSLAL